MSEISVLVVDDEAIVRDSISDWLSNAGYEVTTAETGEEAMKLIEDRDFSVMVLDIRLPGQTGIKVLREVKAQRPWIKSIIITAYPSEETTIEAKQLGAVDYLIKPLVPDDLEKLIRETVASLGREPTVSLDVSVSPAPAAPEAVKVRKYSFIDSAALESLVNGLLEEMEVVGVKARDGRYVYDKIGSMDELRLDFDLTVTPPTRYLRPPQEVLLRYRIGGDPAVKPVLETTRRAIIGVHPYDIKAIELLDAVFMYTNPDPNYIARRRSTLIIGVDCLHPAPKSFAPSMGTQLTDSGFDLLLTDIGNGYIVTVGSDRGAELLTEYSVSREPTNEEMSRQRTVRDDATARYAVSLNVPRDRLPKLLEENYDNPYWESRSRTCLSCGSCVMVCPTCYCFDVTDEVSLNLKDGERIRHMEGCMLIDFAKVASGENFRHDKASRFRHRIFRKGKYVVERYGLIGCVGCGRCATACLADIASPLESFNAVHESTEAKEAAARIAWGVEAGERLYEPRLAELVRVTRLTEQEKVFDFKFRDGQNLGHRPGQFVNVSVLGIGEAPISISSSPTRNGTFQLAVRDVGAVTGALHELQAGDTVGIRGPFGNGFPIEAMEGQDILFIAGGIGLFPLRSLIQYVLDRRELFGRVTLLFGAQTPEVRLFIEELEEWSQRPDIDLRETVDRGNKKWRGHVGVITTLVPEVDIDPARTMAVVVGPPIMYRFVTVELKKRALPDENIIMSLERRMKCGVGKCGQCQINGVYVCQEGPVFTLAQLRNLREAI